jgi:hypothetical protein
MNSLWKRLGFISLVSLGLVGGSAVPARAEAKYTCEMKGMWVEEKDGFGFVANYLAKDGPDSFTGIYVNSSAGATANVKGTNSGGVWTILLTYTDDKHKNFIKELTGKGTWDGKTSQMSVAGNFSAKRDGKETGKGTFTLNGTCKK